MRDAGPAPSSSAASKTPSIERGRDQYGAGFKSGDKFIFCTPHDYPRGDSTRLASIPGRCISFRCRRPRKRAIPFSGWRLWVPACAGTTDERARTTIEFAVTMRNKQPGKSMPTLSLRIDLDTGARIGPGKIALLKAVGETGSISAAGRALRHVVSPRLATDRGAQCQLQGAAGHVADRRQERRRRQIDRARQGSDRATTPRSRRSPTKAAARHLSALQATMRRRRR